MDIFTSYTYSTAAWLGLQSTALIAVPSLIIDVLANASHEATDVEIYFARTLGLALLALTLLTLLLTGIVPLSPNPTSASDPSSVDSPSPYVTAALSITTFFHALTTAYCWICWTYPSAGTTGHFFGALGSGVLACLGGWCVMFGEGRGHVSKRTGADKRTAGWPFKNASAYDKKVDRKMR